MKKLNLFLFVCMLLMALGINPTAFGADYELTTHPVSSLDTFPAANPVSGDFVPVLDGSAAKVKKLAVSNLFFSTNFFASGYSSGSTSLSSTASPLTTANLAFGLVRFANGSPGVHPIPDGTTGKTVTFELIADAAYLIADDTAGDITKTGWVSINFDTAGDRITLVWLDDTTGWIIQNNDGCIVTQ